MRILILGGTRFIGPWIVRQLVAGGHEVTVFHRGQTEADLPDAVSHLHGDRAHLHDFRDDLTRLSPDMVLDLCAMTEHDAEGALATFSGVIDRAVVISSQDVYRAYDRFMCRDPGVSEPVPYAEEASLRTHLYPYRSQATHESDGLYDYDKIKVETVYRRASGFAVTVLRLPLVYGPGDYQHRLSLYLKQMKEGRETISLKQGQAAWRWTRGYVENIAAAIVLAVEKECAAGRIYNLGAMPALSEAAWIRQIAGIMEWTGEIVEDKKDDSKRWSQHLVADTSAIREELGFREPVAFEDALRRTITWELRHPPEPLDA